VTVFVTLASVLVDEAGLRAVMFDPAGPIGRDLARRGVQGESAAKQNASGRPGPNVQTGRLRSSITWQLGRDGLSQYVDVGSNVEYARHVEDRYPYLKPALRAMA